MFAQRRARLRTPRTRHRARGFAVASRDRPDRDGIRASSTAQVAPAVRCGTPSRCAHRAPCQRIARATRARRARATARLSRPRAERAKRSRYPLSRSAARSRSPPPHATSPRSRRRARPRRRAPTRPAARTCTRAPSRGPHLVERQPLVEYPHRSLRPLVPTSSVLLVYFTCSAVIGIRTPGPFVAASARHAPPRPSSLRAAHAAAVARRWAKRAAVVSVAWRGQDRIST